MRLRFKLTLVASLACAPFGLPALADEAAEEFLRTWVASIDASPDYAASFTSLESDSTTGVTTLSGFLVSSEAEGLAVNVDTIAVSGFVPSTDGTTFAARSLRIENAVIQGTEYFRADIANAEFRDFSVPTATGFAWNEDRPFLSIISALEPVAKVEMSTGRISSVVLYEKVDDVETRIAYEQINIDGWAGGKIAAMAAGPITSESPEEDQLIAMSIASAQTRDIDLNAFFHVFNPDNYVGGVGDRVWHTLVGSTIYRDMIVAAPGVTFTMGEATVRDLKLRQPTGGIAILTELGPDTPEMSENPEDVRRILELLTSYGVGSVVLDDIEVTAPGVDELSLASVSLTDYSSDRLGEFAFDRLAVAVQDFGQVAIGRFAFGDLVPPALEAIIAAAAAEDTGEPVDVASVIPKLGFFEVAGVNVSVLDQPPGSLERLRIDLKDYVGPIPTRISYALVDADIDASLIEDPDAREMLAKLGYDRAVLSSALQARWTSDGQIALDSFSFAMDDVGTISGDVTLSGLLPTEYMTLADSSALERLSFVRGSVTAKDDSIVGRGLAMQAADLGIDPEAFREQFAMGLPFMLAFLGDPQLQADLAPVLQQFIKTAGGSITMVSNPAATVPLMELVMRGSEAPFELLKALNVTFSGLPGPTQPAAGSSPAPTEVPTDGGTQFGSPSEEEDAPASGDGATQFGTGEPESEPDDSSNGGSGTQFDTGPAPADSGSGSGTQFAPKSADQKKAD